MLKVALRPFIVENIGVDYLTMSELMRNFTLKFKNCYLC